MLGISPKCPSDKIQNQDTEPKKQQLMKLLGSFWLFSILKIILLLLLQVTFSMLEIYNEQVQTWQIAKQVLAYTLKVFLA